MISLLQLINEAKYDIVVRKGKKIKRLICKPGYKDSGEDDKCIKMTPQELRNRKKGGIKGSKKSRSKIRQTMKKRQKSLIKRKQLNIK